MLEDAADDAALGDEGDHPHHASAAGTDERIDLVNPAKELSPSAAKGGHEGDAEAGGGVEIQQGRTERPSIRWVCHLDPRVDQSRVVEAVLSGAVVLGDGGKGVFHRYLTM